ncbi:MAG: heavy-metal-associated domain-containing protein [Candidatus Thiodiazotropha sp. (ex Dulcina madagascariensis)]|nr:heavy-metal-associated domain-containing protein [Candidatus Thiodiazotropha sp. (ex Epidulcina cf. delphinae)]MCU7923424.1 heavy-metal-associated domain-containing protein [Candidatus Thiodiazotropha sp. (ex Dulcina madagascariensis)]MCU7927173.1 heavy-metal-associated domain-containing protein [Candidatus Thiodiazotropha sp. (ex Dulcina madagascariensis)]MCU7937608.1 heavy-metal-associated domain-containing protein [Candidatus Thiodiazotropha sp. (ex Dulcina madagascariensis)]
MIDFDANAVVHINESLSAEQIHDIEKELSDVRGVVSACAHIKTPHLLVVDYDPQAIHSSDLLYHIERNGVHASLVGGI